EDDILKQAPHLSAPAATLPRMPAAAVPALAGSGLEPTAAVLYVGRDGELLQVTRSALEAATGRMRIVLVTGDAGAGKTALADQVSQRLAAEDWTVTAGRCPEHEGVPAGWAWAEALRHLARTVPPAEPQALATLLTDTPARDHDAAPARFRLHRAAGGYPGAVGGYREEASRAAPLLVVLDDLHRADGETLAILADVTADLATCRILVLASFRPAEASEQLSDCLAALAVREPVRVTLGGLDAAAAGEPLPTAGAPPLAARTGGNRSFIKETAGLLDSDGALAATTEVPAGVREVLLRRIARLPATAQTILRQAAVLGADADADVLGDVAGAEEHVLLDAI